MDANAQADLRNSVTPPTRRLVNEPDGAQQFAAIRMVYMAITNGNPCAAAVLNQFEYRTNCRLPAGAGDRVVAWREQGEIWLTQGQGEMVDVLWGAFRKHEVKQAFKLLVDLGYLHKRLNPNNKFNKTLQYRFDLDAVQAAVDFWWCESWQPFEMPPIDAPDDARDHSTGDRQPLERSEVTSREVTDDLSDGHGRPQETPPATARVVTDGGKEESLSDQSRDQSPEERSGESRAPAREEPPPPPASEFHPIIQAFLDATPEALRDAAMPPNDEAAEAWDNMARRWADTMGATPEEVGEMVRMKWQKPTRDRYEFRWIEGDLVGWRRMQKAMVAQAEGDRSRFQAAAEGYDSFEVDLPVQPASAADPDEDDAEAWLAARKAERVALDNSVYAPDVPEVAPSPHIPGKALDAWQSVYELIKRQYGSNEKAFRDLWGGAYLVNVESDADGDVFLVAVHSEEARNGVRPQTRDAVCRLLTSIYGSRAQLDVVVGRPPEGPAPKPVADLLRERWLQRVEKAEPAGVGK